MIYSDELLLESPLLRELNALALSYEAVEGNVLYHHPLRSLNDPFNEDFFEKRYNLYQLAKDASTVMEIGINAGHSALIMLLANPKLKITFFDLSFHKYTVPCFDFLKERFPGQLALFIGDSRKTMPEFINKAPDTKFDLIHIDGSHITNVVKSDIEYSRRMAGKDSLVILDDTSEDGVGPVSDAFKAVDKIQVVDRTVLGLKLTLLHEIFRFL